MTPENTKASQIVAASIIFFGLLTLLVFFQRDFIDLNKIASDESLDCNEFKYAATDLVHIYGDIQHQYNRDIFSNSSITTALFNQGMVHLFGFNRREAERNFEAAYAQDEKCFSCLVGIILSNGPTINNRVEIHQYLKSRLIINKIHNFYSNRISSNNFNKTDPFVALLNALELRYPESIENWQNNGQLYYDRIYSENLREMHLNFPKDDDIASLYADSILILTPWKYFNSEDLPLAYDKFDQNMQSASTIGKVGIVDLASEVKVAYDVLVKILSRSGYKHLLALHLYIHIMEQTDNPQLAESAADSLANIVDEYGTGHLIHMPSHIYIRIGRYQDAIKSSLKAIALDNYFEVNCFESYVPNHNVAMLIMAAMLSGNRDLALKYSKRSAVDSDRLMSIYLTGLFPTPRDLVMARFGLWESILALQTSASIDRVGKPEYDELRRRKEFTMPFGLPGNDGHNGVRVQRSNLDGQSTAPFQLTMHWYAGALARIHLRNTASAITTSLQALSTAVSAVPSESIPESHVFYPYHRELGLIMNQTAYAAYFYSKHRHAEAIEALIIARGIQDSFSYMEPENFYLPIRQCLGALYLMLCAQISDINGSNSQSDACQSALRNFKQDLLDHPKNIWSLYGLRRVSNHLGSNSTYSALTLIAMDEILKKRVAVIASPCYEITGY